MAEIEGIDPAARQVTLARKRHRLRREIIATRLANRIVNMTGPSFPILKRDAEGMDAGHIAQAFEAAFARYKGVAAHRERGLQQHGGERKLHPVTREVQAGHAAGAEPPARPL